MAKILCAYSGIQFNVEHFPISLTSREAYHPIFDVPQRKLLPYLSKWSANQLTPTDSYLLFLALLKSTDLVNFRVPVMRTHKTEALVAQHMEFLAKTVIKLNTVSVPTKIFPTVVISVDTRTLDNVEYWIANWEDHYNDFTKGLKKDYENRKLIKLESALERLIKNPHKPISAYSSQLGDWAATAFSFPTSMTTHPVTGMQVALGDYWKWLISNAANSSRLFSIKRADLEKLLEHCEENASVSHASIFSAATFKVLRDALKKQENFLGLGDMDISKRTYHLLEDSKDIEDLNIKAIIDTAPLELPKREQYPTSFAYLKAKSAYDLAQRYKNNTNPGRRADDHHIPEGE